MPDFSILISQLHRLGIPLTVNVDSKVVSNPKGYPTEDPGSGIISSTALLGTEHQECLYIGDGTGVWYGSGVANQFVENHAAGMLREKSTAVVVAVQLLFD